MRNKNICLELKMDRVFYFAARRETDGGWQQMDESSAAFALPACHASSTADVHVFTVGFFYRGLSEDVFS